MPNAILRRALPHPDDTDRLGSDLAAAVRLVRPEGLALRLEGIWAPEDVACARDAAHLGWTGPVKSPTFALLESYPSTGTTSITSTSTGSSIRKSSTKRAFARCSGRAHLRDRMERARRTVPARRGPHRAALARGFGPQGRSRGPDGRGPCGRGRPRRSGRAMTQRRVLLQAAAGTLPLHARSDRRFRQDREHGRRAHVARGGVHARDARVGRAASIQALLRAIGEAPAPRRRHRGLALTEGAAPSDRGREGGRPFTSRRSASDSTARVVRLVMDLKTEVKPEVFLLKPFGDYQYRLVFDIYPEHPQRPRGPHPRRMAEDDDPMGDLLGEASSTDGDPWATSSRGLGKDTSPPKAAEKPKSTAGASKPASKKSLKLIIVVDPGHGAKTRARSAGAAPRKDRGARGSGSASRSSSTPNPTCAPS